MGSVVVVGCYILIQSTGWPSLIRQRDLRTAGFSKFLDYWCFVPWLYICCIYCNRKLLQCFKERKWNTKWKANENLMFAFYPTSFIHWIHDEAIQQQILTIMANKWEKMSVWCCKDEQTADSGHSTIKTQT